MNHWVTSCIIDVITDYVIVFDELSLWYIKFIFDAKKCGILVISDENYYTK